MNTSMRTSAAATTRPVTSCCANLYRTALLMTCFSALAGAANAVTLYSETRDAQAKAVKEAWGKVDLKRQIEVPRANLASLLSQQLTAQKSISEVRRDALIQSLTFGNDETVRDSLAKFTDLLDRAGAFGCTALDGTCWAENKGHRTEWNNSVATANTYREKLKALQFRLKRSGQHVPTCSDVQKSENVASTVKHISKTDNKNVKEYCDGLDAQRVKQTEFSKAMDWIDAETVARKARAELDDSQQAADALKKGIADALVEAEAEGAKQNNLAKASNAATKLKEKLTLLLHAQDVFHVELLSQIKQDSLNAFLATLVDAKDGTAPPATSPKAAMAVVLFAQFFDETTSTLRRVDDVSLVPVVLEREVARFQQEAAIVDIQARRDRVALLELRAKILRKQVDYFLKAEDARGELKGSTLAAKVSAVLLGVASKKEPKVEDDQRQQLWLSLASYLQADAVQSEVHSVDLKLAATERAASLAYTEASINAWRTLVNGHVNQLEAWAKAGIRASEIAATMQALATWWIAYGVNK